MDIKNAEHLGPKKYSSFVAATENLREELQELCGAYFNYEVKYIDGETGRIHVKVGGHNGHAKNDLIEFLNRDSVVARRHLSQANGLQFEVEIEP